MAAIININSKPNEQMSSEQLCRRQNPANATEALRESVFHSKRMLRTPAS